MKTAEEIINLIEKELTHGLTANSIYMERLITDYASEACKEQKRIIAEGLPDNCFMPITDIDEGHILNMDEPKLK